MEKFIILGGGCFWCVQAVFDNIDGIKSVISGYSGGNTKNPTYKEICSGNTNHAEVIKICYDTQKINLEQILNIFFTIHDSTTLNRQGNDIGTQYRSIIFYNDEEEKNIVENFIKNIQNKYKDKIVTQVKKVSAFYKAEEYHQDYFRKNPNDMYCNFAIPPKLEKLKTILPL